MIIIFDFDGTIADSFPVFVTCMNRLSREFGYEELKDSIQLRRKGIQRIALEDMKVPRALWPTYAHRLREEIKHCFREILFFSSIKPVIKEIVLCHTVGILSINSEAIIRNTLEKEGLHVDFLFTDISFSDKGEVLTEIMRRNSRNTTEFIYVGDECRDIEACKKAGIRIIAVTWGFDPKEILEQNHPDCLIDNPSELLTLLNRFDDKVVSVIQSIPTFQRLLAEMTGISGRNDKSPVSYHLSTIRRFPDRAFSPSDIGGISIRQPFFC